MEFAETEESAASQREVVVLSHQVSVEASVGLDGDDAEGDEAESDHLLGLLEELSG